MKTTKLTNLGHHPTAYQQSSLRKEPKLADIYAPSEENKSYREVLFVVLGMGVVGYLSYELFKKDKKYYNIMVKHNGGRRILFTGQASLFNMNWQCVVLANEIMPVSTPRFAFSRKGKLGSSQIERHSVMSCSILGYQ